MQPHPNGPINVDAALGDVARIYRSITGRDLPLENSPMVPIPPEQDPGEVAKQALEQLAVLLQRVSRPANQLSRTIPPVDCWEGEGEVLIVVDLPGIDRSTLQAKIDGGALYLSAQKDRGGGEGARPAALERPAGLVERKILLPSGITAEPLGAELSQGVLRIRLSRKEGTMASRTIQVS